MKTVAQHPGKPTISANDTDDKIINSGKWRKGMSSGAQGDLMCELDKILQIPVTTNWRGVSRKMLVQLNLNFSST